MQIAELLKINNAARVVQRQWTAFTLRKMIYVRSLLRRSPSYWKLRLKLRILRKRKRVELIKEYLEEVKKCSQKGGFKAYAAAVAMIGKFVKKIRAVIKQAHYWVECKKARFIALSLAWERVVTKYKVESEADLLMARDQLSYDGRLPRELGQTMNQLEKMQSKYREIDMRLHAVRAQGEAEASKVGVKRLKAISRWKTAYVTIKETNKAEVFEQQKELAKQRKIIARNQEKNRLLCQILRQKRKEHGDVAWIKYNADSNSLYGKDKIEPVKIDVEDAKQIIQGQRRVSFVCRPNEIQAKWSMFRLYSKLTDEELLSAALRAEIVGRHAAAMVHKKPMMDGQKETKLSDDEIERIIAKRKELKINEKIGEEMIPELTAKTEPQYLDLVWTKGSRTPDLCCVFILNRALTYNRTVCNRVCSLYKNDIKNVSFTWADTESFGNALKNALPSSIGIDLGTPALLCIRKSNNNGIMKRQIPLKVAVHKGKWEVYAIRQTIDDFLCGVLHFTIWENPILEST